MTRALLAAACLTLLAACGTGADPGGHGDHPGHGGPVSPLTSTRSAAPATPPAGSPTAPSTPVGDFNLADVMFLQMAVANHARGVELVALAEGRPVRGQVKDLAAAIRLTQLQEIDSMKSWLTAWSQPLEVSVDPGAHAHHGGMSVTDPAALADLAALPDREFEKQFLTLLTSHQHNAVEFALTEAQDGASPEVKVFADRVIKSRTGQIRQLLNLAAG